MRVRFFEFLIGMFVAIAACLAFAQSQTSSSSTSQQGSATATASAGGNASGSGSQSGGANAFGSSLPSPTHAIFYEPGPNWLPDKLLKEQPLHDHGVYMSTLVKKGSLIFAGPWRDEAGGMLLIRAANDAEANTIMMHDPGVKSGVLSPSLKAWDVVFRGSGSRVQIKNP